MPLTAIKSIEYTETMSAIKFSERPDLTRPYLIAGFEGWPNAGKISTETLNHLITMLGAKKFASFDADLFHRYTEGRPIAKLVQGEIKEVRFSPYEFYFTQREGSPDVVLFLGKEPELQWNLFTETFLALAGELNVTMLLTIGGTYDYLSHRDQLVSGVFGDASTKGLLSDLGILPTEYEGPISIHTMLLQEAQRSGIKAMSIWGHCPQYLQSSNLALVCRILTQVGDLVGVELDLACLSQQAAELTKQIDLIVQKNPELCKLVEKIEKGGVSRRETSLDPHDKVINLSDFLRKNHHD
jgi:proteasome assembly chaperone (PAC2) family protein